MRIEIKRFDKELPLPTYKTKGAAAMDLYARTEVKIGPHRVEMIPLNVALKIPEDCWVMVAARGSTHKLGIMMANGIGIGDWDYRGDNDEYLFPALNFTDHEVVVERGARIAQMMVCRMERVELVEVEETGEADRGGFGSTGKR